MNRIPSLVAEATRTAGLVWIGTPGLPRAAPTWHHWHDGRAYVLAGGAEQPIRGLTDASRVTVTVHSKTTGERLVTWVGTVTTVQPGSPEWAEVIPTLHAKRLNAPDGRLAPERWARESVLVRLDPTGELVAAPDHSGAAPPPPTPATTGGRLPFVLGRRRPAKSR
ncbi:hypothetical protein [Actinokineospora sp.]|uniref:hypothetical protein n=1 Tax=Actinokineospora sp. TaxID=1872133 RepID=UPI004037C1DB